MTEAEIIAALSDAARDVLDPETGLNVVDMGLILRSATPPRTAGRRSS